MNLTLEEQETALSMSADDRNTWQIFSNDPVMQRRLEAIGATIVKVSKDGGSKWYTLRANQVSFRKGLKRELLEAQRAQVEKLAASRRNTNGLVAEQEKSVS